MKIFLERRPPPPSMLHSIFGNASGDDLERMQTDSADAQCVFSLTFGDGAEEDEAEEDEGKDDFSDIQAVFDQQIDDMKKVQKGMDPQDAHLAAVLAELERLERLRLELIEMEKERQRLLAEQQAARDAAEKKRLQDLANQLQQEKERKLREERDQQLLKEKLRRIGKCPAGFTWNRTSSGYVCAGGSHHVSHDQLKSDQ